MVVWIYAVSYTHLDVYKRQVEVDAHGMKIRIHENTSSSLIQKVLGALVHVE